MADPLPPECIAELRRFVRCENDGSALVVVTWKDRAMSAVGLLAEARAEVERLRAQRDALVEKVLAIPVRIEHEWRGITEPGVVRVSVVDWSRLCDARNAAIRAARDEKENTDDQ